MTNSRRLNNSIRNMIFGVIGQMINIIFPFFIRAIMISRFGTEYTGLGSLFSSILEVLNVTELGFDSAITFALYKPIVNKDNEKISALMCLFKKVYRVLGSGMLVVGMIICPFITFIIKDSYPTDINIYILFILYLLQSAISYLFSGYKATLIVASQRSDIKSKIRIVTSLIVKVMQLLVLLFTYNYYLYVLALIIGTSLDNIAYQVIYKKLFPNVTDTGELPVEERKAIYKNVGALFGHQLDSVIINSADNIVISAFLGLTLVTKYNNYYTLMTAVLQFLIVITNSFTASIGDSIASDSKEKNVKNLFSFTYILGIINVGASIMMACLYQDFIRMWLGNDMLLNNTTMILIVVSFYARQVRRPLITYKTAAGVFVKDIFKPYVASLINLAANIALVKLIGLNGVILSTIFSLLLIELPWETIAYFKTTSIEKESVNKYVSIQLKLVVQLVLIGGLIFYISTLFEANGWALFIIKTITVFIAATILLIITSFKDKEFLNGVSYLKRMIK